MSNDARPANGDVYARVVALLVEMQRCNPSRLTESSRLAEDVGMDGDDASDFMETYAARFNVDLSGFQFDRHFSLEGFNPFWFLSAGRPQSPITIGQLVQAALRGVWAGADGE